MPDYKTVAHAAHAEFVERRSRFLGAVRPVASQEEAERFLAEVKSAHRTANHHVYAYLLRDGNYTRYSDDGEPQGTAGVPALSVLQKNGVTDTCVVVTRYFGGVLLGAGGLVRAYSAAAAAALQAAGIVTMRLCRQMSLCCEYADYGRVSALVPACGGKLEEPQFTDRVYLRFSMAPDALPAFQQELLDLTNGRVTARSEGESFVAFP